ncbi:MAG TPA: nitrous oxide reductase accessory protein NosL [Vicinamibacterales bacterium]
MPTPKLVIVVFALLSASCSARAAGHPEIVVDQTACSHCGMLVSEPAYAAAYHAPGGDPRVFDDIGCMLDALRQETSSPLTVWLQDAAGGGWIDAHQAVFVTAPNLRTPMNGGVLAYRDVAAADKTAAANGGRVLRSLRELMTSKGVAQ